MPIDGDFNTRLGEAQDYITVETLKAGNPMREDNIYTITRNEIHNKFGTDLTDEDIRETVFERPEVFAAEWQGSEFRVVPEDYYLERYHARSIESQKAGNNLDPTGTGYLFAVTDDSDFYMPNILHVQRDDSLGIYSDDEAAARAAEIAGVPLIYGMPDVPDGVYLDTPENRAAIAEYFERERLEAPASEELTQKLHARLDANFNDYRASMLRLNTSEVFADAAEIVAVCQSYEFFKERHTVTQGQAELLLKYADPLDFISDCWIHSPIAEAHDIINILAERERTHSGFYERASEEALPAEPDSHVNGTGDKRSVIAQIKQHAQEQRGRAPAPKDKPGQKKSGQEL